MRYSKKMLFAGKRNRQGWLLGSATAAKKAKGAGAHQTAQCVCHTRNQHPRRPDEDEGRLRSQSFHGRPQQRQRTTARKRRQTGKPERRNVALTGLKSFSDKFLEEFWRITFLQVCLEETEQQLQGNNSQPRVASQVSLSNHTNNNSSSSNNNNNHGQGIRGSADSLVPSRSPSESSIKLATISNNSHHSHPTSVAAAEDVEQDFYEPAPGEDEIVGTCLALYDFEGENSGTSLLANKSGIIWKLI